eukprot:6492769-Amphidinium_carterae.4
MCWGVSVCDQDKKWALYKSQGGGAGAAQGSATTAVEDKCEECYTLHEQAFFWLDWQALCARHHKDKAFAGIVGDARQAKAGHRHKPAVDEEVVAATKVELELERSFICLSDREMRRDASVSRIPKGALKSVPQIEVPGEGGGERETVYCFKEPSEPYRKLHVKVNIASQHTRTPMPLRNFVYAEQGGDVQNWLVETTAAETGVANLLDKEVHMVSWEDFKSKKLTKGCDDDKGDDVPDGTLEENACTLASESYIGAAAAASAPRSSLLGKPLSAILSKQSSKSSPSVASVKKADGAASLQRGLSFGSSPGDGVDDPSSAASLAGTSAFADESLVDDGLTGWFHKS